MAQRANSAHMGSPGGPSYLVPSVGCSLTGLGCLWEGMGSDGGREARDLVVRPLWMGHLGSRTPDLGYMGFEGSQIGRNGSFWGSKMGHFGVSWN